MKKIFFFAIVFSAFTCSAQDIDFVHTYSSSLNLNPAFAGAGENPELGILFRRQWPSLNSNYNMLLCSFNQYSNALKTGIGAYFLSETIGEVYKMHSFNLDISPSFLIGNNCVLKPALEIAYYDKWIDWNKVTFPVSAPFTNEITFFDYSAGLLVYEKYFDLGFAVHHLTEPNESLTAEESKLQKKFTAHGSVNLPLDESGKFFLSPNFQISQQDDFRDFKLNLATKLNFVLLGIGWQENDSYRFMAGLVTRRFRVSYSYDKTVSELRNASVGSHEFFLSWFILNEKLKSSKPSLKWVAF